jgi:hypothetical protein
LIGLDEQHSVAWQLEFNGRNNLSLNLLKLAPMLLFPTVIAVVAYDEPTEQFAQYAPYTLTVTGDRQVGKTFHTDWARHAGHGLPSPLWSGRKPCVPRRLALTCEDRRLRWPRRRWPR